MKLNSKNATAKLAALRKNVTEAAHNGILDGGAFLMAKLKGEVLNSPGYAKTEILYHMVNGRAEPKHVDANGNALRTDVPQPPHEPQKGLYVRRRTGTLISAVKMQPQAGKVLISMNESIAPYAAKVNEWAKKKYGRGYMQIVSATYRKLIEDTFGREIGRAIRAADKRTPYVYENNFPPA